MIPTAPSSPEAELIRTAQKRTDYEQFAPILKDQVVLPEAMAILEDIGAWFTANASATELDWSAFLAWAKVAKRATWKPDRWSVYEAIVSFAKSLRAPNPAIIERFQELTACAEIRARIEALVRSHTPGALGEIARLADGASVASDRAKTEDMVTDDWEALVQSVQRTGGFEWRLEDLNRAIGPVDRGDLVLFGKRPEAGGTSFVASEISYMAAQLPEGKHAIVFTNEESGTKVKMRIIQAVLGVTLSDIAADIKRAKSDYEKALKGRRIDVVHNTAMHTRSVEARLRSGEYGLIGINILDKITLSGSDSEGVERTRNQGIWARQMADKYGAVIAVCQADASAEGEKWLNQSQLYGSKTGLQGEGDVLIMMGKTNNPAEADTRYFAIAKNKLPGGARTLPMLRHGQFEVAFYPEISRFASKAYK